MNPKHEKWQDEANAHGWEWLSQIDSSFSLYRNLNCGHEQYCRMNNVRVGKVHCGECVLTKFKSEARLVGWQWLEQSSVKGYCLYRHNDCGHVQQNQMGHMRLGNVRCDRCQSTKLREEAETQGWTHIGQIDRRYGNYRHVSCGHQQQHASCNMRLGNVVCHGCGESWVTKPSNMYLLRISVDDVCFLKLGIARDVGVRSGRYGLPERANIEIVRTIAYETGKEAYGQEMRIHKTVTDHPAVTRYNASRFMVNGFTECYAYSPETERTLSHMMSIQSILK